MKKSPLLLIIVIILATSCYNYEGPMRAKREKSKAPEPFIVAQKPTISSQEYLQKMAKEIKRRLPSAEVKIVQDSIKVLFPDNIKYNASSILPIMDVSNEIGKLASIINKYKQTNVLVTGHTDKSGDEQSNKRISQMRAQYIMDLLISYHAPKDRLGAWGLGSSSPVSSSQVVGGNKNNRRVEFVVLSTMGDD